eukprot:CAMPEP_0185173392 /NCGR_PEP_ID=MMETSP1139-20130426/23373_1 /TAXON_ID=298111 /ORGANISM="Pavlova sp., Strain CCMP459" /LENGTH=51 /DNA_ID=CAMNT_0027739083 /DNA_START=35 /DNA_END=187 /DNA_ORIENTATION=-
MRPGCDASADDASELSQLALRLTRCASARAGAPDPIALPRPQSWPRRSATR